MAPSSSVASANGLVARLRARQVSIVDAVFAHVRGEAFGSIGSQDARYVAGLREAVAVAIAYALAGIESRGESLGPVPEAVLAQARRAARAGVSLDTVLRRYVAGHTLLGELVMEELLSGASPTERDGLREVARAQALVLDRLLVVIPRAYAEEIEHAHRSPRWRLAARVRELLADEGDQQQEERSVWAGSDYALDGWHVGLIVGGKGGEGLARALAGALGRPLLCVLDGEESVWAWLGGKSPPERTELARALSGLGSFDDVVCACGEPAQGVHGWRRTHRQAQAALKVALLRPRPLTRYADVALLASALADAELAWALHDAYIALLDGAGNRGPILCETLRAYLRAQRSPSAAAASLGVARTTVENRLHVIEERLGRSLHDGSPELEVALALQELGAPVPTHGAHVPTL